MARSRSSREPSVVITITGTSLCRSSLRIFRTNFSPSMIGMLMSVMIRSKRRLRELLQTDDAVVGLGHVMFLMRDRANTISCRIIGESSTTRQA